MSIDLKLRLAFVVVSAGVYLAAAILAAHGLTPLDDPIGMGPPV
jgi:hypothetical protein